MTILRDNKRIARNLRKQFLKVKGKLWIKAVYIDTRGRQLTKLSDAGANILIRNIDIKRAVFNALTKGIKLCVVENGASSNLKVLKIIDWGMQYGSNKYNLVTVKRFNRGGKYYTGVWVKGSRGIKSVEKYKKTENDIIYKTARDNNLTYDNDIWSDDY